MARPPAIDPKYHDEIIEKYKTGLYSMSELAQPYGVTKQAIGTVLKHNGIKAVKKRMFSDEQEQAIISSYQSGKSLDAVATEFDCHSVSIAKVLEQHKIPRQDYRIINFSDSDIEKMITLYSGGKTTYELGEMFNCDPGVISRHLSKNGIELRAGQFEKQVTKEDETKAIELYQSGMSCKDVGKHIGFSDTAVLSILKRHNIERRDTRNFTDSEEAEVAKLYQYGFSARKIASAYGLNHHTSITSALERCNIILRTNEEISRIYTLNQYAFDKIDNEHAAYWLGFIYADGCVSKKSLIVKLARKDEKQVQRLKAFLQCGHPIEQTTSSASNTDKIYKQSGITITHKHLAARLKDLGITPKRKNFEKCITQIPSNMIQHWIRGLVDGDGSFHSYKPGFNIVGQKEMLKFIRDIFAKEIGLNPEIKIHKHPTAKIHNLVYSGRPQCLKIANYLYKDSAIWMERKRNIVEGYPKPKPRKRNKEGQFK